LFDRFARENDKFGSGIHAIWGIIDGKTQLQAIRFDKSKFTTVEAKSWLEKHDYKPTSFQVATGIKEKIMRKIKKDSSQPEYMGVFLDEGNFTFASAVGSDANGVPTQRFIKDIIHSGSYTHPLFGWNLDVNVKRMDDWVEKFNAMQKNGVDVEVVVDHREDAEGVKGYVKEMFREGDTLYCIPEMIGQKGIDLASVVKNVSILVDRDYKDGKGNNYGEAISHVSIVQQPIVSNQNKFVPIAASKGKFITYPIFLLSQGDPKMNKTVLEELKKKLGIEDELTDDNILEMIGGQFETTNKLHKTQVGELENQLEGLKLELVESKKAASKISPEVKIDPNLAEQMGVTAEDQLNNLIESGKITPASKDIAVKLFIGPSGKRNLMALSLKSGQPSLFSGLVEILKTNDPVELGEKANIMALGRNTPGEIKEVDEDLTKEMIEDANSGLEK